jgi:hypothetical protein
VAAAHVHDLADAARPRRRGLPLGEQAVRVRLHRPRGAPGGVRRRPRHLPEGSWLSVDGTTGRVYAGRMPLGVPAAVRAPLSRLAEWAQSYPVGEQMSAALGEAK